MEDPYKQPMTGDRRGRVTPLYSRMKSLEFGYIGRDFKATERKTPSRSLDQKLYPTRHQGVSEIWELRDYSMGISSNRLAPLRNGGAEFEPRFYVDVPSGVVCWNLTMDRSDCRYELCGH